MCGIAAISIAQKDKEVDPTRLTAALLIALEARGRDAAGVAWNDRDGKTFYFKGAMPGHQLAKQIDLTNAQDILIHTRWATKGTPANNVNNHPIDVGGLIGVHNGHCVNDNALLSECVGYERIGQVDSEAIFAYLAFGPKNKKISERLGDIAGGAAIAWLRSYKPEAGLNVARINSSPLWFANTNGGTFVAASTNYHLLAATKSCGLKVWGLESMPEGVRAIVRNGRLESWLPFTPKHHATPTRNEVLAAYNTRSLFETQKRA